MKKFILSLIAVVAVAFSASAANYTVDDDAITSLRTVGDVVKYIEDRQ